MLKPIGPICNLDCRYCYYLSKEDLLFGKDKQETLTPPLSLEGRGRGGKWKVSEERLANYVGQYIEANARFGEVNFAWQGGEPTLLGVDFFRCVVDLQKRLAPPGVRVSNAMQTNGTLLDDKWCEFLAAERFLIGLSVDGPRELHDVYRVDKKGQPSFDQVMRGRELMAKHGVDFNALVVVNRRNSQHPRKVYRFIRDEMGCQFMQFIPCVERTDFVQIAPQTWDPKSLPVVGDRSAKPARGEDALVSEWSVAAEDYGRFLCEVFDEWIVRDVGHVFVQIFDVALGQWMGLGSSLCVFAETCGNALAMEHDGSVYSCDHYVYPEYRLGSIDERPLLEMVQSDFQRKFGDDKRDSLPRYCRECPVRFACNGECPKNRFIRTPDGEPGLNYLCAGLKRFFTHIDPWMRRMAAEVHAGRPASNVMNVARSQRAAAGFESVGANDLCPCGSGRKFKKCCMGKAGRPS
ncbi:MAG: Anaerobic sulfatase-maturating enzyme [Phycisphaerae bacterium]|nr:Anaerobic sulfatase-maturating enzyme [Phycisphaerae bacterium]